MQIIDSTKRWLHLALKLIPRGLVLFAIVEFIANASGWVYTTLSVRSLNIEAYGDLVFLINITMILALFSMAFRVSANRFLGDFVSQANQNRFAEVYGLGKWAGILGLGLALAFFQSRSWWMSAFSFSSSDIPIYWFSVSIGVMFLVGWMTGSILAYKWFYLASGLILVEVIIKSGMTVAAFTSPSISYFAAAIAIPTIFSGVFMAFLLFRRIGASLWSTAPIGEDIKTFYFQSLVYRVGVVMLLLVDLILVKRFLSAKEAGLYALMAVGSKIILFVANTFYSILTPAITPYLHQPKKRKKMYSMVLVILAAVCVGIVLIIIWFPEYTLGLVVGDKYSLIQEYIGMYLAASVMLAMVMVMGMYNVLLEKYLHTWIIFLALILEISLISIFHKDIGQVVGVVFGVSTLLVLWMSILQIMGGAKNGIFRKL